MSGNFLLHVYRAGFLEQADTVTVHRSTCRLQRMAVRATLCLAAMLLVCLVDKVNGLWHHRHECTTNRLVERDINPRFNITKGNDYYYLTILWLCSNDQWLDVPIE